MSTDSEVLTTIIDEARHVIDGIIEFSEFEEEISRYFYERMNTMYSIINHELKSKDEIIRKYNITDYNPEISIQQGVVMLHVYDPTKNMPNNN